MTLAPLAPTASLDGEHGHRLSTKRVTMATLVTDSASCNDYYTSICVLFIRLQGLPPLAIAMSSTGVQIRPAVERGINIAYTQL